MRTIPTAPEAKRRPSLRGRPWSSTDRTGGPLDGLLDRVRETYPHLIAERLEVAHPGDDDNVYFLGDHERGLDRVQLDTGPDGQPQFIIEAEQRHATSDPDEAATLITTWLRATHR